MGDIVRRWVVAAWALLVPFTLEAQQSIYRVPVSGVIELGLAPYVGRAIAEAEESGAIAIVLDIETPGGRIDAEQQIVKAILASNLPVYALVNAHAWSAGAVIALAADSIYMVPGSSIGAATPVTGSGEKASEKVVSAMRGDMRALAERRGVDPHLLEAMVDEDIAIPDVIEAGKLLTLTAGEAVQLGVAAAEVASLDEMLDRLGIGDVPVETPPINWAEHLVRFLSNPVVAPLLLSIGTLGLIIEIKTPSFGIAGLVGLLSFTAFFGSHLIVGLAGLEEFLLLAAGLVALGIEVFVVPGFGIAGVIALICISASVFLALIGSLPTWSDFARASGILFAAAIIVVASGYALVRNLPKRKGVRGIFLATVASKASGFISGEAREELIGAEGIAITDLRPSGTIRIGSERLDVVSDVGFVPNGTPVRVIRTESYRHVVEPIEEESSS